MSAHPIFKPTHPNANGAALFSSTKYYADCDIIAVPGKFDYRPYAYAVQQDSPYAGIFDHHISFIRENGNIEYIMGKYGSGRQVCPDYR